MGFLGSVSSRTPSLRYSVHRLDGIPDVEIDSMIDRFRAECMLAKPQPPVGFGPPMQLRHPSESPQAALKVAKH